ncbi:unnamed protein product [Protopolystoma xenopodis]|uniref:Uncharacterized protein n=1 Tax=Protopolystoma xenopodis TaxID=117903 RepID=A0A448WC56_9PLAT|nr:unnamed protein product [Protopolystoma xenopodis]
MVSGCYDVHHMTDKSSTRSHQGRKTVSRGLLRTLQQAKGQGNPPEVSGEANLRISLTRFLKRNESVIGALGGVSGRTLFSQDASELIDRFGWKTARDLYSALEEERWRM